MENFNHREYRDNLAKEIKETDEREEKKNLLKKAQATQEYQEAKKLHLKNAIKRRDFLIEKGLEKEAVFF